MPQITRRVFLRDLAWLSAAVDTLGHAPGCSSAAPPPSVRPIYRVGLLAVRRGRSYGNTLRHIFWERMTELGYISGQNLVRIERAATGEARQFDDFVTDLVLMPVD